MNDDIDKKLCEKYPKIFRDRNASPQTTCMCWGIAVGPGWYNILNNACSLIQHHINWSRTRRLQALVQNRAIKYAMNGNNTYLRRLYSTQDGSMTIWQEKEYNRLLSNLQFDVVPDACPQVVAVQVKEKFGSLRFYYNGGDTQTSGIISMAEAMSGTTCEDCGNVGKRQSNGWIRVLCDPCHNSNKEEQLVD